MKFLTDDQGATTVEYALMLAVILVIVVTAIQALGLASKGIFSGLGSLLAP